MSDIQQELVEAVSVPDAEILKEAFSDEAPQEAEAQAAEPEKSAEPNRDPETGKFTAKPQQTEPEPKAEPEKARDDGDEHGQIPSWRLREVAEARRAAEAKAEAEGRTNAELKARLEMLERQLQQSQKPKEEPKQEDIDPLIDPQGFAKRMQDNFSSQLREYQLNTNLQLAHVKHGETFEKAYNALIQAGQSGNRQIVNQLTNSANPGESIVKWYRDQETLREVGSDPAAYKQRILDEAMKDPAFQAKIIETVRGAPAQNGSQRPNTVTQLPPSLSRVTGSKSGPSIEDDTDGTDKAVFDYAFR